MLLAPPWLLRSTCGAQDVPFVVAMAGGLALVFVGQQQPLATAPNPLAGNIAARRERPHMGLHHHGPAMDGQPRRGRHAATVSSPGT